MVDEKGNAKLKKRQDEWLHATRGRLFRRPGHNQSLTFQEQEKSNVSSCTCLDWRAYQSTNLLPHSFLDNRLGGFVFHRFLVAS